MIGRSGGRGSGISVLAARHDDDDDLPIEIFAKEITRFFRKSFGVYLFIGNTM